MTTKTFRLSSLPSGYYLFWYVVTQTGSSVQATLRDSSKVYFTSTQQSTKIDPPLAMGSAYIEGTGLELELTIPASNEIKSSINSYSITSQEGTRKGKGMNISIEDYTDADYNDVSISLVAWISKG